MEQMKIAEGVTEELKQAQQMEWVQRCNNIHNRAEEIILHEMIYIWYEKLSSQPICRMAVLRCIFGYIVYLKILTNVHECYIVYI